MRQRNPLFWLTDHAVSRRGRWATLAIWLVVAGALGALAPNLTKLYDNNATGSIGNQESVRAAALLQQAFPNQNGVPALIVISDASGLSAADRATAQTISDCLALVAAHQPGANCVTARLDAKTAATCYANGATPNIQSVLSVFTVPGAAAQLVASDGTTMTIIASLGGSASDPAFSTCDVKAISTFTKQFDVTPLQVKVSGPAGVIADAVAVFASTDVPLLLGTVLLVLILLLVIYRSPVLALAPLVAVGWALTVTNALIAFAAQAHWFAVSQQATSIMTVLLFGAGTDYSIFIAARYREELRHTSDRQAALQSAMRGVGEAITSSAGTVILGLLVLTLTTLGLYKALGPVMAIAIAVMLLAGLTLVPALLSVLGRAAFWPFAPQVAPATAAEDTAPARGLWGGIAQLVTRRPMLSVVGSALLLGVLALGNLGVPEVFNFLTGFRTPTDSKAGYTLLARHFSPGTLAPFTVVIHAPTTDLTQHLVALDQIDAAVAGVANVAAVSGPTRPTGTLTIAPAALQADINALPASVKDAIRNPAGATTGAGGPPSGTGGPPLDPQVVAAYAASLTTISADGHTALLRVTLGNDPYSVPALDTMAPVRAAAQRALAGTDVAGGMILLAGVTPQLADTRAVSDHDKLIVVPLALALTAVVLALLLRSLVAPLYLLAAVTLNYFAALGAAAFLFTKIQGDDGLAYATPLYTFIFLVALGADYTIFLMSRVREETARRGLREGTRVALSQTGGVITSAGLILAGTFLVLTTLPLRDLYQFGVAVALGIVLDTFIVRGFLVPGIVLLLGRWNWWPGNVVESQSKEPSPQG